MRCLTWRCVGRGAGMVRSDGVLLPSVLPDELDCDCEVEVGPVAVGGEDGNLKPFGERQAGTCGVR
jgi:hypothetical protein